MEGKKSWVPSDNTNDVVADELDDVGVVKVRAGELLREPGAGERLANIWGSGAGLVLEETHAAMGRLLKACAKPSLQFRV